MNNNPGVRAQPEEISADEWAAYIRDRLLAFAGSQWGLGFDDINSRISGKRRSVAREQFKALRDSGTLHIVRGKRDGVQMFKSATDAEAWVAAGRPVRPKGEAGRPLGTPNLRPKTKRHPLTSIHDRAISPHWRTPAKPAAGAKVCASGLDERYVVLELPADYRSVLDPNECRGWARACSSKVKA